MANGIHKGSEFNNVSETWDRNEQKGRGGNESGREGAAHSIPPTGSGLDEVIKEEAAAYDKENKENQLLGGERASVDDTGGEESA